MQLTLWQCDGCDRETRAETGKVPEGWVDDVTTAIYLHGDTIKSSISPALDLCPYCYERLLESINPRKWVRVRGEAKAAPK